MESIDMAKLEKLNIEDLCFILGYEKHHPSRDYKHLMDDVDVYFTAYEARENYLSSRKKMSDHIVLCAQIYLQEESRAERFWPENTQGYPIWPIDENYITDAVSHIFRRKGISSSIKRSTEAKRKREGKKVEQHVKPSPKSSKKRPRDESDDRTGPNCVKNAASLERLAHTTVNPWNEPPKNPDPRCCSQYILSLNPQNDVQRLTDFTIQWLKTKDSPWPESADKRLQIFMHNREFYVNYDYGDDPPPDLAKILRKGTEIEELDNGLLCRDFLDRIRERVEYLTRQLARAPLFVLEFRRDGAAQMTKRFSTMWRNKELYWDLGPGEVHVTSKPKPKPSSKRRKLKIPKSKRSPVAFPNLRDEERLVSPTKTRLTAMATALGTISHQSENEEQKDKIMHDVHEQDLEAMKPLAALQPLLTLANPQHATFASDALAVASPSISAKGSIIANGLGRAAEETPNSSPPRSPRREQSSNSRQESSIQADGEKANSPMSGSFQSRYAQRSKRPPGGAPSSRTSMVHSPTGEQHRPSSSKESPLEILDDDDDDSLPVAFHDVVEPLGIQKTEANPINLNSFPPMVDDRRSVHQNPSTPNTSLQQTTPVENNANHGSTSTDQYLRPPLDCGRLRSNSVQHLPQVSPVDSRPAQVSDTPKTPTSRKEFRPRRISASTSATEKIISTMLPDSERQESAASPSSPSQDFDRFLAHCGRLSSESEPGTPPKDTHKVVLETSTASLLKRQHAEAIGSVRGELAAWQSKEGGSASPAKSPPQASAIRQPQLTDTSPQVRILSQNLYLSPAPQDDQVLGDVGKDSVPRSRSPPPPPPPQEISHAATKSNSPSSAPTNNFPVQGQVTSSLTSRPSGTSMPPVNNTRTNISQPTTQAHEPKCTFSPNPRLSAQTWPGTLVPKNIFTSASCGSDSTSKGHSVPHNSSNTLNKPIASPQVAETAVHIPISLPCGISSSPTKSITMYNETSAPLLVPNLTKPLSSSTPINPKANVLLSCATQGPDLSQLSSPKMSHRITTTSAPSDTNIEGPGSCNFPVLPGVTALSQSSSAAALSERHGTPVSSSIQRPNFAPENFTVRSIMESIAARASTTPSLSGPSLTHVSSPAVSVASNSTIPPPMPTPKTPTQSSISQHQQRDDPDAVGTKSYATIHPPTPNPVPKLSNPPSNDSSTDTRTPLSLVNNVSEKLNIVGNKLQDKQTEQLTPQQQPNLQQKLNATAVDTSRPTSPQLPGPRLGPYAHVPEPIPFSATPSKEEIAAVQALQHPHGYLRRAQINQDCSIVKSATRNPGTKTLELLIESADGEMNLQNGYSYDVVKNNNLAGFFSFYASVSKAPVESFNQLIFTPTWGNNQSLRATRFNGEAAWKRLKSVVPTLFKQAQRDNPSENEFQIMVQMG